MNVEVHLDWCGQTHLVGRLFGAARGTAVSFEYERDWLAREDAFSIDPTSLPLRSGQHHAPVLFGAIQDCGPDRWGKILIERAVRRRILAQKPYRELDYVLALDDATRLGSLRFRLSGESVFLAPNTGTLPPLVKLNVLMMAADAIHQDTETAKDLRFLLGAGSPLGGARPKSAVEAADGSLAIAKFPKPDDARDIAAGEALAMALARKAGIQTAETQLLRVKDQSVIVVKRFDRENGRRVPFISAATLLGLSSANAGSYTLLADGIRRFGDDVAGDLRQLWRRMVFSLLVCNFDDHLRNHGFLMRAPGRWALSPAYDINPVPAIDQVHVSQTPIAEEAGEPSLHAALQAAARFGLKKGEAKDLLGQVLSVVGNWKSVGRALKIKTTTLNTYTTAFEHPLIEEARHL